VKKQWKHGKILKLEGSTPKGAGPLLFCPYSGVSVRFRSHVEILNLEMVSTSKIIGVIFLLYSLVLCSSPFTLPQKAKSIGLTNVLKGRTTNPLAACPEKVRPNTKKNGEAGMGQCDD
jgi:hypothetical protein